MNVLSYIDTVSTDREYDSFTVNDINVKIKELNRYYEILVTFIINVFLNYDPEATNKSPFQASEANDSAQKLVTGVEALEKRNTTNIYGNADIDNEIYKFNVIIPFCKEVIADPAKIITTDDVKDYIGKIQSMNTIQRNLTGGFKGISGGDSLRVFLNKVAVAAHIKASRPENLAMYHDPSLTDEIYPGITDDMKLYIPTVQHLHMLRLNPMRVNVFKNDPVLLTLIANHLHLLINQCVLDPNGRRTQTLAVEYYAGEYFRDYKPRFNPEILHTILLLRNEDNSIANIQRGFIPARYAQINAGLSDVRHMNEVTRSVNRFLSFVNTAGHPNILNSLSTYLYIKYFNLMFDTNYIDCFVTRGDPPQPPQFYGLNSQKYTISRVEYERYFKVFEPNSLQNRIDQHPYIVNEPIKPHPRPAPRPTKFDNRFYLHVPIDQIVEKYLFNYQKDTFNAACSLLNIEEFNVGLGEVPAIFDVGVCYNRDKKAVNCTEIIQARHLLIGNIPGCRVVVPGTDNLEDIDATTPNSLVTLFISEQLKKIIAYKLSGIVTDGDFKNYGFDIGISNNALKGGDIHDISVFIDSNATPKGLTMIDRLRSSYGESLKNRTAAVTIYNNIFRGVFGQKDNESLLFSLILNYFHVYNISFSSIYSGICFPSILYNASVLSFAINKLASTLNISELTSSDSIKSQMFKFFEKFFKIFSNSNYIVDVSSPLNQINYHSYHGTYREENLSYNKILLDANALSSRNATEMAFYTSMYTYPTVSSDFINFLLKLVTPCCTKYNNINKFDLSVLFTSNFLSNIRHLDSITTYISVIFTLLKQTTHYSSELALDTNIFNGENPEPFSIGYNINM
jgi:hypothetical protein